MKNSDVGTTPFAVFFIAWTLGALTVNWSGWAADVYQGIIDNDGILVHDLNGDDIINNITEILSKYYGTEQTQGMNWNSATEALASLDSDVNGSLNNADTIWNELLKACFQHSEFSQMNDKRNNSNHV